MWLDWWKDLGRQKRNDELHLVFCEDKASDILWFEAAHEMGSFKSLAEKQLSGIFNEDCSRRNTWQRFLPGEGPFPIHTEVERRAAPEAFLKNSAGFSQYLSWRVWELWHHLCGICGFSCILVLCNKLDTKFNQDTASYTSQVTKCGGQLIRTVYALSRWWVCAWNGDTTVFSK